MLRYFYKETNIKDTVSVKKHLEGIYSRSHLSSAHSPESDSDQSGLTIHLQIHVFLFVGYTYLY